jgi:hypothetical protein
MSQEHPSLSTAVRALLAKEREYRELIAADAREAITIADVHGWKSTRYEAGVKLREELAACQAAYDRARAKALPNSTGTIPEDDFDEDDGTRRSLAETDDFADPLNGGFSDESDPVLLTPTMPKGMVEKIMGAIREWMLNNPNAFEDHSGLMRWAANDDPRDNSIAGSDLKRRLSSLPWPEQGAKTTATK